MPRLKFHSPPAHRRALDLRYLATDGERNVAFENEVTKLIGKPMHDETAKFYSAKGVLRSLHFDRGISHAERLKLEGIGRKYAVFGLVVDEI